ncbi:MAG: nicotinate (nicotinamide) nucleotide adenylyltransferase [Rikenellaceae bacterium]
MEHIILYFGSFNPIHTAHLEIAKVASQIEGVDRVWFVVSPQNPMKDSATLAAESDRLQMVTDAIKYCNLDDKVEGCDIEFSLSKPSYTYKTLEQLWVKYPDYRFSIIMGSDNLCNLYHWRNIDKILSSTKIFVYPRHGYSLDKEQYKGADIEVLSSVELMNISSTNIRENRSDDILEITKKYIESHKLYK